MIHDLSVIFGNKAKQKETLALLCLKCFGSCCSRKGNRNIQVVKRCLFSGCRSVCLYNFYRRQNNLWSGFYRRVLWKVTVVHVELRVLKGYTILAWIVISEDYAHVCVRDPWKVVTSTMLHWKNGPVNWNCSRISQECYCQSDWSNVVFRLKFQKMSNLMEVFY